MTRSHAAHHPERLRLPRWVRGWVYVGGGACAASGAGWLLLHTFVQKAGEFGPEPHPLEHPALVAHGVTGLMMLWVLGLVWLPHVRRGWAHRIQRIVGGTMAAVMLWLALTAAGLYYLGDERLRDAISMGHWSVGLFGMLWLPIHIWAGRRRLKR
ncbi:hypothetical protein [Lysobacter xanthus]